MRTLALALVCGTALVLAIDALLHLALGLVRDAGTGASGWVNARVLDRVVALVAALLLWWAAPHLGPSVGLTATPSRLGLDDACRLVGRGLLVVPLIWWAATVIVFALRVTVVGDWRLDAARFLHPYYYSELVLANAPWMLAGATLIVLARHLASD